MKITPIAAASLIPATVAGVAFTIMPFVTGASAAPVHTSSHPRAAKQHAPAKHAQAPAQHAAVQHAPAPASSHAAVGGSEAATASQPLTAGMSAFEKCVAWRESSDNPTASSAGLFGILPSTWHQLGYSGTAGEASIALQKVAFARLYAQLGTQPWAPYDGC